VILQLSQLDDQSPSFTHGFTCGKLWQRMVAGESPIEETILHNIAREVGRLATNQAYRADWEQLDEHWAKVTLTKQLNMIHLVK
jgi:hypothetical protein